jgi:YfiR/HmsC-like
MLNKALIFIENIFKLFFLCLLLLLCTFSVSAESVSSEYKIKAALLYKLTRFIEWSNITEAKINENFGICILGQDDFGQAINALATRKTKGLPITIERFNQSSGIKDSCHLVFISDSKKAFFKKITQSLVQHPILTVSDSEDFALNGGMIQLAYENKKITFKINLKQVKYSGLSISATLLELSTIVDN